MAPYGARHEGKHLWPYNPMTEQGLFHALAA